MIERLNIYIVIVLGIIFLLNQYYENIDHVLSCYIIFKIAQLYSRTQT
jgi:hypothetical protein